MQIQIIKPTKKNKKYLSLKMKIFDKNFKQESKTISCKKINGNEARNILKSP